VITHTRNGGAGKDSLGRKKSNPKQNITRSAAAVVVLDDLFPPNTPFINFIEQWNDTA
jgi:hypothetical protein